SRRYVAIERVVRARLVGQHVGRHPARYQLGKNLCRVAHETDRQTALGVRRLTNPRQRFVETMCLAVAVTCFETLIDARLVDVDAEDRGIAHRRGERLRAAHAAESGREDEATGERAVEVRVRHGAERLE